MTATATATCRPATRRRRFGHDEYTAVDLFSGFGGLTQGIESAGFTAITGYGERMARNVVAGLLKKGYLQSTGPRAPLSLAFPLDAVERWFPRLYPAL